MKWVSKFRQALSFGCERDQPSCTIVNLTVREKSEDDTASKKLCAICLEAVCHVGDRPVFTAECSHEFHLSCIASNVRHGSVSCPICRATWTHLPRSPNQAHVPFEDDDPVDSLYDVVSLNEPPLTFSISHVDSTYPHIDRLAWLSVRLSGNRAPTDLVAVLDAMRLGVVMQSVSLLVSYLGPADRLAVVACSKLAVRLRRMTSSGKREVLRAVNAFFATKLVESNEGGLKMGMKILGDRVYRNPASFILCLSDIGGRRLPSPALTTDLRVPIREYSFRSGAMGDFGEYLECLLGSVIRGLEVRIGDDERWTVGSVRLNFERRIMVNLGSTNLVRLSFRYMGGVGVVYGEKLLRVGRGRLL